MEILQVMITVLLVPQVGKGTEHEDFSLPENWQNVQQTHMDMPYQYYIVCDNNQTLQPQCNETDPTFAIGFRSLISETVKDNIC